MKIGILTLPLNSNYGGILQAYALQTFLKKRGHDVFFINRKNNSPFILKILVKKIISRFKKKTDEIIIDPSFDINIRDFITNYITPQTREIKSEYQMHQILSYKFDAVIVGSDQVWRHEYYPELKRNFFLDFVKSEKIYKISYAASFGVNKWDYTPKETKQISKLAKEFDAISVREDIAVEMCKKYLAVQAEQLIDPTMLLNSSDYEELCNKEKSTYSSGLFVYMLGKNEGRDQIVERIKQFKNLSPFVISLETKNVNSLLAPVTDWIAAFIKSDFVVTDSFHGCVFSIIFKKQFIVLAHKNGGVCRFTSLLSKFNLTERLIYSLYDLTDELLNKEINYNDSEKILEKEKLKTNIFFEKMMI